MGPCASKGGLSAAKYKVSDNHFNASASALRGDMLERRPAATRPGPLDGGRAPWIARGSP